MPEGSLHDRLRRLRRPAQPPLLSSGSDLDRLEQTLLGGSGDGPSLKARLERLVAAASMRSRRRSVPLEELVRGRPVRNALGQFFLVEESFHIDTNHGEVPFSRLNALHPGSVEILTGEPELQGFEPARAVFLDTETTGLAGGAGTAAFLVGIGFVEDDRFVVRQYFMRDYDEEAALLKALADDLRRFSHIVTFNGKMFDVPLLETRYRLNRERFPLSEAPHLDLLHPARRLWKLRLESCRLVSLESALMGVRRRGDIPGEEIPRLYFDYVRSRDGRALERIFEHNRMDVASLAALAALACQWVAESRAEDPRDVFSLARVLERARLFERSAAEYRRTLAADAGALRVPALMRLASHAKRAGDFDAAVELWQDGAAEAECLAFRELAIHHERRRRDPAGALAVVDAALEALAASEESCCRRTLRDFERRRVRLLRKRPLSSRVLKNVASAVACD